MRPHFPEPPAVEASWMTPPHTPRPQRVPRGRSSLVEALRADPAGLAKFWQTVAARGTPLIEGDGPSRQYTFLHRGGDEVRRVALVTNKLLDPTRPEDALLERIPGTDVWSLTLELGAGWRGTYSLAVDAPALDSIAGAAHPSEHPDRAARQRLAARRHRSLAATGPAQHAAINDWYDLVELASPDPRTREYSLSGESVGSGPQAPRPLQAATPTPPGRLIPAGTKGHAWWHLPDVDPGSHGWDVLVLADGDRWSGAASTALDVLSHSGAVPPTVTLLLGPGEGGRAQQLTCNPRTVELVLDLIETAPQEALGGPLTRDPERTTIAGQSLGGLQALYSQCVAPERFGASISQSGSLWWPNAPEAQHSQWLTRHLAASDVRLDRVHLEVGRAEWVLLDLTRELREVLHDRCEHLGYTEFDGGHDAACWAVGLPHAVAALAASRR